MKRKFINIALTILTLIIVIFILECAVRIIENQSRVKEYRTNSKGFHDYEYTLNKRGYRIITLGDSVTYGIGVERDVTFAKILEKKIRDSNSNVDVINLGVPGYNTEMETDLFVKEGLKYQPDLVILLFNLNDPETLEDMVAKGINAGIIGRERLKNRRERVSFFTRFRDLINKSKLYNLVKYRFFALLRIIKFDNPDNEVNYTRKLYNSDSSKGWEICKESIRKIDSICKKSNISLYLFIMPYLTSLNENYPFKEEHKAVSDFCKINNIQYHDLFSNFKGNKSNKLWASILDAHPNNTGHRIIANAIFEQLFDINKPYNDVLHANSNSLLLDN